MAFLSSVNRFCATSNGSAANRGSHCDTETEIAGKDIEIHRVDYAVVVEIALAESPSMVLPKFCASRMKSVVLTM